VIHRFREEELDPGVASDLDRAVGGDDARYVSAMPVTIVCAVAVVDCSKARNYSPTKLTMGGTYSGIDNIYSYASPGGVEIIVTIQRQVSLIDSIEAPGGTSFCCRKRNLAVFLNKSYTGIFRQALSLIFI
jgi:hypothetical protein